MPHMPHRTMQTHPKPAVAEETPIQRVVGVTPFQVSVNGEQRILLWGQ